MMADITHTSLMAVCQGTESDVVPESGLEITSS